VRGALRREVAFALVLLALWGVGAYVRLNWRSRDLDVYFDSYEYLLASRALLRGEYVVAAGTPQQQVPYHPPGYPAAILATAGFGDPQPRHPALTAALMGTVATPLAGLAGAALFGLPAGLVAAAFWALNPLHVAYSQLAMADSTALALMLAGAALWLRGGGTTSALLAGVAFALAFLTRYAEAVSLAWLVLLAPRSAGGRLDRKLWAAAGVAVCVAPFALWQLTRYGLTQTTYGHLGETFMLQRAFTPPHNPWMYGPELGHLPAYLYFLATGDGRPFIALGHSAVLLALAAVVLWRGTPRERVLGGWLLAWMATHVLVYSTIWNSEPRYMIPAYVPLAWLAGAGLVLAGRRSRVLAVALMALLLVPPVWLSRGSMFVHRPGPVLRQLPELLRQCPQGARIVSASSMAVLVYDPARAAHVVEPDRAEAAGRGATRGPTCIVVDATMSHYGRTWLEQTCRPGACRAVARLPGLELRLLE
jgi:4-amino-4-deoxy-L-arabinose transferase-like glycosyltransferase